MLNITEINVQSAYIIGVWVRVYTVQPLTPSQKNVQMLTKNVVDLKMYLGFRCKMLKIIKVLGCNMGEKFGVNCSFNRSHLIPA